MQWRTKGFWRPGRRWELAPLPFGVSDWQAPKALSLAIGGSGHQPPKLLRAFGCKWKPFLNSVNTIFNSACQTGKRRRRSPGSPSLFGGTGAEPQPPTLLGAFGCKRKPFLNSVNTIFNSACQTGKRRRRSPSLFWGTGAEPQPPTLLGVNGTHF